MIQLDTRPARPTQRNVDGNERLTGLLAAVLLVALAAEGLTILRIEQLRTAHVFLGMLLVPLFGMKLASTGYRMVRYYRGDPAYRRKGAPRTYLRLLGPVVSLSSIGLLASGIVVLAAGSRSRDTTVPIHQVVFAVWFVAMTVHVLSHLVDTARLARADLARPTRAARAPIRFGVVAGAIVVGLALGVLSIPWSEAWRAVG